MKTYTTPVLTDMTLGEFEIDGEKHTVVGVGPFLAAAASAAAAVVSAIASVTSAKQTFKDNYMEYHYMNSLEKVD